MSKQKESKKTLKNLLKRKAIREDVEAVGGVGLPSKMPGTAWGTSAKDCRVGGKLAQREGTVCHVCYAMKNNYVYPSVMGAHERRKEAASNDEAWIEAWCNILAFLGNTLPDEERYHRWFDSGDLRDATQLDAIVQVAIRNPEWAFWLPSKEYGVVRKYAGEHGIPGNLAVRMSATVLGQDATDAIKSITGLWSTVGYDEADTCPAPDQEGECGRCRACWDVLDTNKNYRQH